MYNVHTNDLLLEILVEIAHINTMLGAEPGFRQSTVFVAATHRHDSGPIPPSLVQFVHANELLLKTYVELPIYVHAVLPMWFSASTLRSLLPIRFVGPVLSVCNLDDDMHGHVWSLRY